MGRMLKMAFLPVLSLCGLTARAQWREWEFAAHDRDIVSTRRIGTLDETSGAFTLEIYLCPRAHEDVRGEGMVCSWGNGYSNGWRLTLRAAQGGYTAAFSLGNDDGRRGSARFGGVLPVDVWTSLAVTFDGVRLELYRDGVKCSAASFPHGFKPARPARLDLGGARHGISFFPFLCSRLSIAPRAHTADEMADRYRLAVPRRDWSDAFVRRTADCDFRSRRFADAAAGYGALYRAARAKKSPARAETGIAYADALEKAGRVAESRGILLELAGADDLPSYLTAEAAGKAGIADPRPPHPYPACEAWKPSAPPPCVYVVATNGDDSASGTEAQPLATLAAALERLRGFRAKNGWPAGGATVFVRGGRYAVREPLVFDAADSGEKYSPLVISAWPGEKPVFDGAWELDVWRQPTEEELQRIAPAARGRVSVADLPASFGELPPMEAYGFGRRGGRMADLAVDGRILPAARHPDTGFAFVTEVLPNGVFRSDLSGLDGWEKCEGVIATGYWWNFWSDRSVPVATVDPLAGTVTLAEGELRGKIKRGAAFFLTNALRALDREGEWFLDRAGRKVYAWRQKPLGRWSLTRLAEPFLRLKGAHHVVFRGLTFEGGAATAVEMDGVADIWVKDCIVRNCSRGGIAAKGVRIRVDGCSLHSLGRGAIRLDGGSRGSLVRADNIVIGCESWDLGRHWRTYSPALHATGCGVDIIGNRFHDLPSSAIRADANDVRVVSNRICRCVLESDDQGAFDIYADPTFAGVEIMHNHWSDIGGGPICRTGQAAVRLDDMISCVVIRDNTFVRCGRGIFGAVQINGGRSNFIDRNVFASCPTDVSVQNCREEKWRKAVEEKAAFFSSEAYLRKYPGFGNLPSAKPVNYIWRSTHTDARRNDSL